MTFETQDFPVIQARWFTPTDGRTVRLVVLHDMEAPEKAQTAENVANYFRTTDTKASAHYCVDADSIVQCVFDRHVAWAAPGANHDGVQIEQAGYARQTRDEWLDAYSRSMIENTANLAAQLCLKFAIPTRRLTDDELRHGHKGIVDHAQVSRVYKRSSHTDCGPNYPWDVFQERLEHWHGVWSRGGPDEAQEPAPVEAAAPPIQAAAPPVEVDVAVIAGNDVDEGIGQVLAQHFDWQLLREGHPEKVRHAILIGAAAGFADRYTASTILAGANRVETAKLVSERIRTGAGEP